MNFLVDKKQKDGQKNSENFLIFSFRWTILPSDVSMPGGELGPTLKLKRFFFNKKYNDSIERLYVWFDLAMYFNLHTIYWDGGSNFILEGLIHKYQGCRN